MSKYKANIEISLRKSILDVQGKTVEKALHSIGYENISEVRIGKFITLEIESDNQDFALEKVDNACKDLLANPIIEDYKISLEIKNQ